ncbi:MAG: NAD-dependent epimerase/dehydratase family protein [DPANN group archaeon]|nr:NAD-dependent epimerase/dehydratase family protein [DPANN group archaeon]
MRILITGGTGFIGLNIVKALMAKGHELVITGHDAEQKIDGFSGTFLHTGFLGIDWSTLGRFDVVYHQAAINDTTFLDREDMFRNNVAASEELFRQVIKNGCRHIVYASSTAVYGDVPAPYREEGPTRPLNPYAESKLALEKVAQRIAKEHPDAVIVGLRYCNVYGPGESHKGKRSSMIYQLARQMMHRRPRIFFDGEQKRDWLYVKDCVRANLLAAEAKESCVVNCGSGMATTFNELIRILNKELGTDWKPEYFENPIRDRYQDFTLCDMSAAKEKIGFVPEFDIEKGIAAFKRSGALTALR